MSDGRTLVEARSLFIERLLALGRAHDALFRVDWSGVPLHDIVAGELGAFPDRVDISGPSFIVMPGTVQAFTLVLHELVTNAIKAWGPVKHGALSGPAGRIVITWTVENEERGRLLRFEWKETGGPAVAASPMPGFGTKLLRQGVSSGEPELLYEPSGFIYRMLVPLTEMVTSLPNQCDGHRIAGVGKGPIVQRLSLSWMQARYAMAMMLTN